MPEATPHSQPSWFGFPIAVRPEAPFSRHNLIRHLDQAKIDTRLLFGSNLTRQPAFQEVTYRKIGDLKNSDFVMSQVFWIGVYPGLTEEMMAYVVEMFVKFMGSNYPSRRRATAFTADPEERMKIMHNSALKYDDPTEPVAPEDWKALQ
jgi:dTDP-4-amino-4,6-dideoxygalactose transaminase